MNNILGLSVIHRDHVSEIDGSTVELTNLKDRSLTVMPKTWGPSKDDDGMDMEQVQTVWKFGENAEGEDVCHHCRHCTHTK